jgi:hypothetical protein
MDMDRNPYLKLMKIDNKTLTKMKYMLNKDDVWVSKNQVRVHTRKKKSMVMRKKSKRLVVMMKLKFQPLAKVMIFKDL